MIDLDIYKDLPALATPRLLLRKLRMEDAEDLLEYARDSQVAGPGMWEPLTTIEQSRQDLQETFGRYTAGLPAQWGIEHRAGRKLIGRCGFNRVRAEHSNAELGYALSRSYWGQGLMSAAAGAALDFGFERLALRRIEAICLATNAGSIRVLEKLGMRLEGVMRECYFIDNQYIDLRMYSILAREWAASRQD